MKVSMPGRRGATLLGVTALVAGAAIGLAPSALALTNPNLHVQNRTITYGDNAPTMTASSNSSGTKSWTSTTGPGSIQPGGQTSYYAAGTLHVHVSQAQSGGYASATANGTLTINRADTNLVNISGGLNGIFSATLWDVHNWEPIDNALVGFEVGGHLICLGQTDWHGRITCNATSFSLVQALQANGGFETIFPGSTDYQGDTEFTSLGQSGTF